MMQKMASAAFLAALTVMGIMTAAKSPLALSTPLQKPAEQVFKGRISDSACGLDHAMPGETPAQCSVRCVRMGAKYVLANDAHQKVYALSDQAQAASFAGQAVKVTGTLRGAAIEVKSIAAIK